MTPTVPSANTRTALETRDRIKRVAMRLFGSHDPDSISVREIAHAAGQKNISVLNYHFGSKETLLRELIVDVATIVDADRRHRVQEFEADGGPHSIRQVVEVLMRDPRFAFSSETDAKSYGPFIDMMLAKKGDLLFDTIGPELGPGTRACLHHLRRMLPALPEPLLSQRLRLALLLGFAALSSRRDALGHPHLWPVLWTDEIAQQNLIDTVIGLLEGQVSPQTTALLLD